MAFTPFWATGWETGSEIVNGPSTYRATCSASTTQKKTGAYALKLNGGNGFYRIDLDAVDEFYFGFWIYPDSGPIYIKMFMADGTYVRFYWDNNTGFWAVYLQAAALPLETGTIPTNADDWHHLQIRLYVDGANGIIQTKVDGTLDIDYGPADTEPGASSVLSYMQFYSVSTTASIIYVDNFTCGTGGFPGDLRAEGLFPDADTPSEDWTRSAGADTWDLINEVPPSDADYISSAVNGEQSIVDLTDWTGTAKVPKFVVAWVRGWKTDAVADQISIIDQEGGDTNVGPPEDLLAAVGYINKILLNAPDGTAWDDTHVDALQLGVESVIV